MSISTCWNHAGESLYAVSHVETQHRLHILEIYMKRKLCNEFKRI